VKQIRTRLTYANVMSSIAVFLILGGATAIAASKIGTSQLKAGAVTTGKIKKEAVTTSKIKKNAVTGAKVNEGTLGTVPSATSATSAGNAGTVNGQSANKIFTTLTEGQTNVGIAVVGGFTLTASCNANDADLSITPPNGPGSVLFAGGEAPGSNVSTFDYESNKPGEAFGIRVDNLSAGGDATYGTATVDLATNGGTVVSGVLSYDYDTFFNNPPNTCIFYGHLLAG
jgi:hypothetical protein